MKNARPQPRKKNTTIIKPRRYVENDAIDAGGEVVVIASGGDNPDWLVGAN
jgi:hypothetical protein